jgi:hypothetical protein
MCVCSYVYVRTFTCATVNKTVDKASAWASELASSCMCCHHLVKLASLHLNAGYSDIIITVAAFFLLFLSCSLCYFYCFLESIFFFLTFSVGLSFFVSPFFTHISVSFYSISMNFSFSLPTFFHSLFPSFSFLLCFFLMYSHTHTHTHTHVHNTQIWPHCYTMMPLSIH